MITVLANRPTVQRCTLHREFVKRWRCHWKTVDNIFARARKEMMERLGRPKEVFRCESLSFYEAKMTDSKATVTEQIRARQRVDELLGLDAPKQVRTELSGPHGAPVAVEDKTLPQLTTAQLRHIIERLEPNQASGLVGLVEAARTDGNGSVGETGTGESGPD